MRPNTIHIVPKREHARAVAPGLLAHLRDVEEDYMIADPVPDFRDWDVTLTDGRRIGIVEDILFDTSTMTASYVEVKVDRHVRLGDEDRWVLIPVESVRLDADETEVVVDHLPIGGLAHVPRSKGELPTSEEQRAILAYFEIRSVGAPRG